MSEDLTLREIETTAVQSVNLWEAFLERVSKDKKLSGKGKEKVSSSLTSGGKKEKALKKAELAKRIVKNISQGYGVMLSTNADLNKKAVPVVWVGEEALTSSKHFTMVIEKGQAVIFGKGMKKCVFLSNEKASEGGESLNFDERFGEPNFCFEERTSGNVVSVDSKEIDDELSKTSSFAAALWGSLLEKLDEDGHKVDKSSRNGLSSKSNKKREKAFAEEIKEVLKSGQSVIYSTDPEMNDREMSSYIDDVRKKAYNGVCSMAVEPGKVTLFADEEKVVYISERRSAEEESEEEVLATAEIDID